MLYFPDDWFMALPLNQRESHKILNVLSLLTKGKICVIMKEI